jgi:hypothetical protein
MNKLIKSTLCIAALAACAMVSAAPVASTSAGTFGTAQSVDGFFTLGADANIRDSTTIAHVEITQAGRPSAGYDFYRFNHGGGIVHLDVDDAGVPNGFDDEIGIWGTADGVLYGANDDNGSDPGSVSGFDAAIFNLNLVAGNYTVGVCRFACSFGSGPSISGNQIPQGGAYRLIISANNVALPPDPPNPAPEPATLALTGLALLAMGAVRRRRG